MQFILRKMPWCRIGLCIGLISAFFVDAAAIGPTLRCKRIIPGSYAKDQDFDATFAIYLQKGSTLDKKEDLYLAIFDTSDGTILVTYEDESKRDSIYHKFIPADQIVVQIASNVCWNDSEGVYVYSYTIHSHTGSRIPVTFFRLYWDWYAWSRSEHFEIKTPDGWDLLNYNNSCRWESRNDSFSVMPGTAKSGFEIITNSPPIIGSFLITGKEEVLDQKGTEIRYGYHRGFSEYSFEYAIGVVENDHFGLEGKTMVPHIPAKYIVPAGSVRNIINYLDTLRYYGYIKAKTDHDQLHNILSELQIVLEKTQGEPIEIWEPAINSAIENLESFRFDIEPEALSYISEHLKYIIRNRELINFDPYRRR